MRFLKNEPYTIFYKETMDENAEFKILNILPRQSRPTQFENITLKSIYKDTRKISNTKYKIMIDLLCYIPPEHQDFFKLLLHSSNPDDQK